MSIKIITTMETLAMPIAEVTPSIKQADLSDDVRVRLGPNWSLVGGPEHPGVAARLRERFGVATSEQANRIALLQDGALAPEAYTIDLRPASVTIRSSSGAGFHHAVSTLLQLVDGPVLPTGTLQDAPRLPVRGLHFMFESVKQLGFRDALALMESAARHKLNTILMEFGDRFPFEGRHSVIASPSALSPAELRQLVARAGELGLTVIPLLQSLGHLNYVLRHDEYASVLEEDEVRHQLCPMNDGSFRLWTELAEQVLGFFPGCDTLHLGADETRQLGVCPACAARASEAGKAGLYLAHINKICGWCADRGIAPVVWDDILCAHPGTVDRLHESARIMYWDYWTTCDPSPLLIARGCSPVVTYDARWDTDWASEGSDVTRKTMKAFGRPSVLEKALTPAYKEAYGNYLGHEYPKYVRGFPYLDYYQDKGRTVYGAPTCSGNHTFWHDLPDLPRHGENIKAFADRCIGAGAAGMVATAWYNRSPEFLHWGILTTAAFTW